MWGVVLAFALRRRSRLRGDEPPIRAVIPIRLAALSDPDYAAIRGLIAIRLAALCAADCAADSLPGSESNPPADVWWRGARLGGVALSEAGLRG
jgi:hypothetical protein